jgi:hypothetical protein
MSKNFVDVSDRIEIVSNTKGRMAIYLDHHKFIKSSENRNLSHFRCTQYKRQCRARLTYDSITQIAKMHKEHNHEPDTSNNRYLLKDATYLTRLKVGTTETILLKPPLIKFGRKIEYPSLHFGNLGGNSEYFSESND